MILAFLLSIVVIALAAAWPRIPHRYLFPVCEDAECLEAAAQVGRVNVKWKFILGRLSATKRIFKEAKAAGVAFGLNVSDLGLPGLLNRQEGRLSLLRC